MDPLDDFMRLLEPGVEQVPSDTTLKAEIEKQKVKSPLRRAAIAVKNRRLAKLILLRGQGYFSDASMQNRSPALYHKYVGQFLSQSEKKVFFAERTKLSEVLSSAMDCYVENRDNEFVMDDAFLEEDLPAVKEAAQLEAVAEKPDLVADASPAKKSELRRQFVQYMERRFLAGGDRDFVDYNKIDLSPDLSMEDTCEGRWED